MAGSRLSAHRSDRNGACLFSKMCRIFCTQATLTYKEYRSGAKVDRLRDRTHPCATVGYFAPGPITAPDSLVDIELPRPSAAGAIFSGRGPRRFCEPC